jgi:hypothetical protein
METAPVSSIVGQYLEAGAGVFSVSPTTPQLYSDVGRQGRLPGASS